MKLIIRILTSRKKNPVNIDGLLTYCSMYLTEADIQSCLCHPVMPQGWTAYQVVIFFYTLACCTFFSLILLPTPDSPSLLSRSIGGWASGKCPSGWGLHTADPESTRYQHNTPETLRNNSQFILQCQTSKVLKVTADFNLQAANLLAGFQFQFKADKENQEESCF